MEERIWKRPQIVPMPAVVNGKEKPIINLNGSEWKLSLEPSEKYYQKDDAAIVWEEATVPLQLPRNEKEYAYAYQLIIPKEWKEERIFLRFDGVNCEAKVYVNGSFVRSHYGGFVSWDCEISEFVDRDEENLLVIGVSDDPGGICPFHTGGIIRDVSLFALSDTYISRLHADVKFDESYKDAMLTVHSGIKGGAGDLTLSLTAPNGSVMRLGSVTLGCGEEVSSEFEVKAPLKWDSEHPYLYTLTAELIADGKCIEKTERQIGFRQIEKRGNQIFVNGDLLKLHGINRHDIHPITGRAITHELVEQDVALFKAANINFIRTSHYPPRPDFLDLCDKYGVYVEDETAVAFLGQEIDCHENDPEYTDKFMDQFTELIERDRSHPCVIIWSLANECFWGTNLALENKYAHQEDPTRLTIFSYPITQKEDDDRADIWSMHYAAWDQDPIALVDSFDRSEHEPVVWPVLHDESTHIPCYDRADHRRDQGVRDFWGETIKAFWDKLWSAEGALGCAIWAGIDEVWYHPSRTGFLGLQWGIIDGWRRLKPEYWHVRKAYSPIRLMETPYEKNGKVAIQIENRFNHTNLNEIEISWRCAAEQGTMYGPDLSARMMGELCIPASFVSGKTLVIEFKDAFGNLLDEAEYLLDEPVPQLPKVDGGAPDVLEFENALTVKSDHFSLSFCKETGLIKAGYVDGNLVLSGGPYLHLTGLALAPWEKESFTYVILNEKVVVSIKGAYGKVKVGFDISIDQTGLMETAYTVLEMPYASPRKLAMRIGDDTDSGGYEEVGIKFIVPEKQSILRWKKTGLWNVYPDWHIGRLTGCAYKHGQYACATNEVSEVSGLVKIGEEPVWPWAWDERNQVLFGKYDMGRRGTHDFSAMKSGILTAKVIDIQNENGVEVLSDGKDSVRMKLMHNPDYVINDRDPRLEYKGSWIRQDVGFATLNGTETWSNKAGDTCSCHFTGTGICWISSMDILGGQAKVYVDGELMDESVSMGVHLQTPGIARGYEKDPGRLVYAIEGLEYGEHTLTVEVKGERAGGSMGAYVFIDHFLVLNKNDYGDSFLIIDSEYNYPELSWGCYTKPAVKVSSGYSKKVYTRLV